MNKKEELIFKGKCLKWMREFFEMKGIPEARYPQFSFAGSCENAPTTYWLDKEPHDRAGFGLGVGRLIQFLLGETRWLRYNAN